MSQVAPRGGGRPRGARSRGQGSAKDNASGPDGAGEPDRYGAEGHCYQQLHPLPDFDGNRPVLGTWVVDGEAAGLGIRETDDSPITHQGARFLPHLIV